MKFFVGLHQPSDAKHFDRAFISVNRLRTRKAPIGARKWIMDSGAFTEIAAHGEYRSTVEEYAAEVQRWVGKGMLAAVAQDWMCEPFIVEKTGLSVGRHQELTIERYEALLPLTSAYVMPVLQGYAAADYVRHIRMYGALLPRGAWVGVGSVCKRNTNVASVEGVLLAIKQERPDLHLHAFGLKITALASGVVRDTLATADSMAWSYSARKQGRSPNDWREAEAFARRIETMPVQLGFDLIAEEHPSL